MKKILVIEDQEDILDDIKTLLGFEGFKVYTAVNGEHGVLAAKSYLPDLIISDIMLPGIDGYEVLKQLHEDENTYYIPFIFLTAKVDRHDLRKGMGLGADDYIFKPYEATDLLSAINIRLIKQKKIKEKIIHTLLNSPVDSASHSFSENDYLFIATNKAKIHIKLMDIIQIRAENQYSSIHCANDKSYLVRKALNDWQNVLPKNTFVRIHRTNIINLRHVLSMKRNNKNNSYEVFLDKIKEPIKVSRAHNKELKNMLIKTN